MTKCSVIKFNLDVLAKPVKLSYNDEVVDVSQAQQILKKFMLGDHFQPIFSKDMNK